MTHISQHIHDAFPADAEAISRLKKEDGHFRALAVQFAAIDVDIAHAENGDDPASDARIETLKKRRLALLDQIAAVIAAAQVD